MGNLNSRFQIDQKKEELSNSSKNDNEVHGTQTKMVLLFPREFMEELLRKTTLKAFPPEITVEILLRLPIKDMARFQLVCKKWHDLIHEPYFIAKHQSSSSSPPTYQFNVIRRVPLSRESFQYLSFCDGLKLLRSNVSQKYYILNPAIHKVLELPDPSKKSSAVFLSCIPATRIYKLVSRYNDKVNGTQGFEVFTLGQDITWRALMISDEKLVGNREDKKVVSAGLAVYCIKRVVIGSNHFHEVTSLDLASEKIMITTMPKALSPGEYEAIDWNGRLAFAKLVKENLQVIELEDYKKHKWGERKIIPLAFLENGSDSADELLANLALLKKENKVDGNLVPLSAENGYIWFWLKDVNIFCYKIEAGTIGTKLSPTKGNKITKHFFPYKPSLVSFRGMQPDTKYPTMK